ncbi:RNA-binding domain-containing protein, partial [Amniculicola lignicola CBS 123094]
RKEKKERKDRLGTKEKKKPKKKPKKAKVVEDAEPEIEAEPTRSKKRKREALPDEIEVDVSLPEPLSKKEARRAKKGKTTKSSDPTSTPKPAANADAKAQNGEAKPADRSKFGVWIGNLPWSANKETLSIWITGKSDITAEQITRVHMPAPTKPPNPRFASKPQNRGFAYVDFSTETAMYACIALTETLMDGRALLIKNATNFEGRPARKEEETGKDGAGGKVGHPPNKRIFVGNLGFDVTKEDLQEHFTQCGEIADIHMATFEDTGKCKGFAWITFEDVEAATGAVKGYIFKSEEVKIKKDADTDSDSDSDAPTTKSKKRKWYVNQLMGRQLRCEFAEDNTTRYNKRYGKESKPVNGVHPDRLRNFGGDATPTADGNKPRPKREFKERRKVDPRTIAPGAALSNAPRASQAIVPGKGKKTTFE